MELRKLTLDDVTVTLVPEEEDVALEGHFESGDADQDKELEERLIRRLERGDRWAWCCAAVTVSWGGWKETAYLGCCSYDGEDDFRKGGYYEQMVEEALEDLNKTLARTFSELLQLAA